MSRDRSLVCRNKRAAEKSIQKQTVQKKMTEDGLTGMTNDSNRIVKPHEVMHRSASNISPRDHCAVPYSVPYCIVNKCKSGNTLVRSEDGWFRRTRFGPHPYICNFSAQTQPPRHSPPAHTDPGALTVISKTDNLKNIFTPWASPPASPQVPPIPCPAPAPPPVAPSQTLSSPS
jgi:hypothetical protein